MRTHADFLESHVEKWTVTNKGTLVPGITRHYIRINPAYQLRKGAGRRGPRHGVLVLANQRPGDRNQYPAKEIVDAGFLELVRFGVRKAGDPLIEDSLKVVDAVLKVDTPKGPCWKRYNHDGYGQRDDGKLIHRLGRGTAMAAADRRTCHLRTGRRSRHRCLLARHREFHHRHRPDSGTDLGLVPTCRTSSCTFGGATGSAIPLMWAHSEYVKLLRSVVDKRVFDLIEPVAERYRNDQSSSGNRSMEDEPAGAQRSCRRLVAGAGFFTVRAALEQRRMEDGAGHNLHCRLRWEWSSPTSRSRRRKLRRCASLFTGRRTGDWQGRNYQVNVQPATQTALSSRKVATGE